MLEKWQEEQGFVQYAPSHLVECAVENGFSSDQLRRSADSLVRKVDQWIEMAKKQELEAQREPEQEETGASETNDTPQYAEPEDVEEDAPADEGELLDVPDAEDWDVETCIQIREAVADVLAVRIRQWIPDDLQRALLFALSSWEDERVIKCEDVRQELASLIIAEVEPDSLEDIDNPEAVAERFRSWSKAMRMKIHVPDPSADAEKGPAAAEQDELPGLEREVLEAASGLPWGTSLEEFRAGLSEEEFSAVDRLLELGYLEKMAVGWVRLTSEGRELVGHSSEAVSA